MKRLILFCSILVFFASTQAYAASVFCPNREEIRIGMDKGDVVMKCGAPMWQDKNVYYTGEGETRQTTILEVFVYSFPSITRGHRDEKITVNFVNGIARSVKAD